MNADDLFDLLAIADEDREQCHVILTDANEQRPAVLNEVLDSLVRSLGTFEELPLLEPTQDERVWLAAYLLLTPVIVEWHRARGVPERITRDTLADVGRHIAISRRTTGGFGLQTWRWLSYHFTARLFALGRLQYALHRSSVGAPGVFDPGDWVLGVHIPESGSLTPTLVDESLAEASAFFAEHFADKPVSIVTIDSWMLDPHLRGRMPAETNLGGFIRRFTPLAKSEDAPAEALYFVFRTRDLARVPSLPRDTTLQRAVLERAESGEPWQLAWGYLELAAPAIRAGDHRIP